MLGDKVYDLNKFSYWLLCSRVMLTSLTVYDKPAFGIGEAFIDGKASLDLPKFNRLSLDLLYMGVFKWLKVIIVILYYSKIVIRYIIATYY